jgi:esterase/lipase superfamily enzyme
MNSDPKVLFHLLAKIVTGAAFIYVCASWRGETVIAQANLSAQVVVTGTVTNSDGALISAATVQAISETGKIASQTTSLEDGSFRLILDSGAYTVRALREGKVVSDAKIVALPGEGSSLNLKVGAFFHGTRSITRAGQPESQPKGQIVRIFYATDREPSSVHAKYGQAYGADRSLNGSLSYGTAFVSIPRDHKIGELEDATFWSFNFLPSAGDYVSLSRVNAQNQSSFFSDIHATVDASDSKSVLVFIHGYNVSFEDAARRTAQMAYDLGFDGAPILYSWPSKGRARDYPADEESIQWTTDHLRMFLEDVARKSGGRRIQLIAHSMGNRALLNALTELSRTHSTIRFREIVLAAPDIDAGVFRQISSAVASEAGRVTLYASSTDRALAASQRFHQFPRAGEAGNKIVIMRSADTVDATTVDTSLLGHSYFADSRSVLADLFSLIRYDLPPQSRFGLEQQMLNQQIYWKFKP